MLASTLIVLWAYLWGGVPFTYLAGRYLRGIDIREYGSGNVGASNLMEQTGTVTGLLLGVFDSVGKGTVVVLAARLLDQSLAVQAAAGVAVVAGHNWSPYLRFTGGRGVATVIGVMLGFLMWREMLLWVVTIGVIGKLIARETAFTTLLTLIALPFLEYLLDRPEFMYMFLATAALLILKRLLANWEAPAAGYNLPRVLMHRLLWDRDVPRNVEWTARSPR